VLAIMLPNRVELVTSMFAALRLGAAVTPVNAALTAQEARYRSMTRAPRWSSPTRRPRRSCASSYRIIGLTEGHAPPSCPVCG
jgi:acyl-coenzyme A synthetase/AMP-(fatty) acid ligase